MNAHDDLISVIIPIYNVGPYLSRCLDSILHNTYQNLEIICVDDGSTDGSGQILEEYARIDSRITAVHIQNSGLSNARNEGLKYAHGAFISFIDSDDWIHKRHFEILHKILIENHADLSVCDYIRCSDLSVMDFDITEYSTSLYDIYGMMSNPRMKRYVWKRLYKSELLESVRFRDIEIEDAMFIIDLIAANPSMKIVYTDEKLYAYYIREGSLITKLDYNSFARLCIAQIPYLDHADKKVRECVAMEIVKKGLSSRYAFYVLKDKENYALLNSYIKKAIPYITQKRFIYSVFVRFPWLYRIWRISGDRTMLTYERLLKHNG